MSRRFIAIVSLLISLLFVSVIWQFAETFIHSIDRNRVGPAHRQTFQSDQA
ncbi:MAG: hypothetical protein LRZ88_03260 [Candidatus Cloacimonetes bacterium]|nr:hypothetical protein [Candidatus Cloacimonadota bacterium]